MDATVRRMLNTPPKPHKPKGERLTPEEIELLRREAKETDAMAKKAFANLRPKPTTPKAETLTPSELELLARDKKRVGDAAKKAFSRRRPKKEKTPDK